MLTFHRTVIKWVNTLRSSLQIFFKCRTKLLACQVHLGILNVFRLQDQWVGTRFDIWPSFYFFVVSRFCSFPQKYIFNIKGEKYGYVFAVFFVFLLCFQIEKSIVKKQSWIQVWLLRLSNPSFGKRKEDFNSIAIVNLFPQTALELCKNLLNARSWRIIYTNQLKL